MSTVPYDVVVAYVGDPMPAPCPNIEYIGWAAPNSPTSHSVWRIAKLFYDGSGNFVFLKWAKGNRDMNNVWDDRTSLTYT